MVNILPTVLCLIAGAALIFVECMTPGIGAAGVFGVVSLIAAVILQIHNTAGMLFVLTVAVLLIAAGLLVLFELGSRGKLFRSRLALNERIEDKAAGEENIAEGAVGTALTALRPVGAAEFDGRRIEVQTNGEFLAKGARIRVCGSSGLRLLVEQIPAFEKEQLDGHSVIMKGE